VVDGAIGSESSRCVSWAKEDPLVWAKRLDEAIDYAHPLCPHSKIYRNDNLGEVVAMEPKAKWVHYQEVWIHAPTTPNGSK
jgi:hypothetical protein